MKQMRPVRLVPVHQGSSKVEDGCEEGAYTCGSGQQMVDVAEGVDPCDAIDVKLVTPKAEVVGTYL